MASLTVKTWLVSLLAAVAGSASATAAWDIESGERVVDLSLQYAVVNDGYHVKDGSAVPDRFYFALGFSSDAAHVARIEASWFNSDVHTNLEVKCNDEAGTDRDTEIVSLLNGDEHALLVAKQLIFCSVDTTPIAKAGPGDVLWVQSNLVNMMVFEPPQITQDSDQLVVFESYMFPIVPYTFGHSQSSLILPDQSKIIRRTQMEQSEELTTHGQQVVKYKELVSSSVLNTAQRVMVHFKANTLRFWHVNELKRSIQISHWGNAQVENRFDITHVGAKHTGPVNRYKMHDVRNVIKAAIHGNAIVIPKDTHNLRYFDDLGYIHSMQEAQKGQQTHGDPDKERELWLQYRFPLVGGWRTSYTLAYDMEARNVLQWDGQSKYRLTIPLLPNLRQGAVIEDLSFDIVLPETATNIVLSGLDKQTALSEGLTHHVMDIDGRPTLHLERKMVLMEDQTEIVVEYTFELSSLAREPIMGMIVTFAGLVGVIVMIHMATAIEANLSSDDRAELKDLLEERLEELYELQGRRRDFLSAVAESVKKAAANADAAAGKTIITDSELAQVEKILTDDYNRIETTASDAEAKAGVILQQAFEKQCAIFMMLKKQIAGTGENAEAKIETIKKISDLLVEIEALEDVLLAS
eukprot:Clim_evm3s165 gene=Clim_evmTU3s165